MIPGVEPDAVDGAEDGAHLAEAHQDLELGLQGVRVRVRIRVITQVPLCRHLHCFPYLRVNPYPTQTRRLGVNPWYLDREDASTTVAAGAAAKYWRRAVAHVGNRC